jgi:hypothetical protein
LVLEQQVVVPVVVVQTLLVVLVVLWEQAVSPEPQVSLTRVVMEVDL